MNVKQQEPLAPHTNINLGGPAQHFVNCQSVAELKSALQYAIDHQLAVHVMGGGTNTIFSDQGFSGLVIKVDLRGIHFTEDQVTVAAGEPWDSFVTQTLDHNLAGLESLSGIPGLVGATPIQNVGAYGAQVSDTIVAVEALDRQQQQLTQFSTAACQFGYRTSRFKQADADRFIITAVTFKLSPSGAPLINYPELQAQLEPSPTLSDVRQAVLALRQKKSMLADPNDPHSRSLGSFFINPVLTPDQLADLKKLTADDLPHFPAAGDKFKVPAAYLVEQAGFTKGQKHGGVGISPNHALALVNYSGTTTELLELASQIKDTVEEKFNIALQPEPIMVKQK